MTTNEVADNVDKDADACADAVSCNALHAQTAPVSLISLSEITAPLGGEIQINIDEIPPELKKRKRWVMWKKETRNGKLTKVPYTVDNLPAKASNRSTWSLFDVCLESLNANGKLRFDGIGYEFDKEDCITGIDIDHCRNADTGAIEDWASQKIQQLDSYAEISPSGAGVHIFVKGTKTGGRSKRGNIEMYDAGRFFTVTGAHLNGTPLRIEYRQDELDAFYAEVFGDDSASEGIAPEPTTGSSAAEQAGQSDSLTDSDKILLKIALRDGKMKQLYTTTNLKILYKDKHTKQDKAEIYGSDSEADKALLCKLTWWTNGDPLRTRRLALASARCRDKWTEKRKGSTWLDAEIKNSCAQIGSGFADADVIDFLDEDGKISIDLVAKLILEREHFLTFIGDNPRSDRFEMYHYDGQIYRPAGRSFIEQEVERLVKHKATTTIARETVEKISRLTRVDREEYDTKAPLELIPLREKAYNILTGEFTEYSPEVPFFIKHGGMYKPDLLAQETVAKGFLKDIFPERVPDPTKPDQKESDLPIILEFAGSCFYREHLFKKALMLLGSGDNGKSLLLRLLKAAVGKSNVSTRTLQALSNNRFASSSLYHKTANIVADIGSDTIRWTAPVKTLAGDFDEVDAEKKLQTAFSFVNTATLIFSANELAELAKPDPVFYDRFVLVEMIRRYMSNPDSDDKNQFKRDPFLKDKLNDEREIDYFTTWAIEGLKRLLRQGHYTKTASTKDVMARWVNLTNSLLAFVNSDDVEHTPGVSVVKRRFYETYVKWCHNHKMVPISEEYVGRLLPAYIPTHTKDTKPHTWTDIAVKGVEPFAGSIPKSDVGKINIIEPVPDGQERLGDD